VVVSGYPSGKSLEGIERSLLYSDYLITLDNISASVLADFTTNAPYDDYNIIISTIATNYEYPFEHEDSLVYGYLPMKYITQNISSGISKITNQYRPIPTLKTQSKNAYGVVYFDRASRSGFVNKIGELSIPSYKDIDVNGVSITTNRITTSPVITINHTPPIWATHYAIAYIPYINYEYFLQYYALQFELDGGMTKIRNTAISSINTLHGKTIIEPYIWKSGDRIRILTKKDGKTLLTNVHDYEIVKTDTTFIWIAENITGDTELGTALVSTGEGFVYEIYRNRKTNKEEVYYTTPYVFPIVDGYHKGNTQDQTISQPCIITADIGDRKSVV
jgi:hypothetical protein